MLRARAPKVLVTGATGGLGKALVKGLLSLGFQVRATGRREGHALHAQGAEFIRCDLVAGDLTALTHDVDGLFHCAALSSPWGSDEAFQTINVDATHRLLRSAKQSGCQRFVFVSSPSVYAAENDQLNLTEADPISSSPLNAYARTKAAAEALVLHTSSPDMACVALRPRAIIGPDDEVLLPRLLRLVKARRFPLIYGGRALIEPTDVRDVVAALITAYDRAPALTGQVINISGGRSISVRDMASKLALNMGTTVQFLDLPHGLVRLAALASEALFAHLPGRPEPPLTVYSLAAPSFSQTFDLAKARACLDYQPRFDAIETALELTRPSHGH